MDNDFLFFMTKLKEEFQKSEFEDFLDFYNDVLNNKKLDFITKKETKDKKKNKTKKKSNGLHYILDDEDIAEIENYDLEAKEIACEIPINNDNNLQTISIDTNGNIDEKNGNSYLLDVETNYIFKINKIINKLSNENEKTQEVIHEYVGYFNEEKSSVIWGSQPIKQCNNNFLREINI